VSTTSRTTNDNIANILAMAETVREVLPHIPDELILQVLFGFTFVNMSLGYSFVPCLVCLCVSCVSCTQSKQSQRKTHNPSFEPQVNLQVALTGTSLNKGLYNLQVHSMIIQ
jgi:hypothetical protein